MSGASGFARTTVPPVAELCVAPFGGSVSVVSRSQSAACGCQAPPRALFYRFAAGWCKEQVELWADGRDDAAEMVIVRWGHSWDGFL
jgi:hypothetical protein